MQVKEITLEYNLTFNLGNYQSVKPTITMTAALGEDDDPTQALTQLRQLAHQEAITAIRLAKQDVTAITQERAF